MDSADNAAERLPLVVTYFEVIPNGGRLERPALVDFDYGGSPRKLDLAVLTPCDVGTASGYAAGLRWELGVPRDESKQSPRGWF